MKKAERSEPSLEVSEYNLAKSGVTNKNTTCVKDLIRSLEQKGDQSNLTKKLRYIQQKNKVLSKPLEKPAAERIKRAVGYEKVKEELQKWDSVVTRNRIAEQLSFPLKRVAPVKDSHTSKIPKFLSGFSTKSDLMKKFEELDSTLLYPDDKEELKNNKYKMTLEEVILRRKEAAKLRAQQSYKETKAHRQRKIKSKKFHRIQRKDKIKQQLKDFEKLKDSNPEEALVKLEQLDKTRAEERMSLRHKNTGQWARNKQIKAKYNKETRQILTEQLAISKELTQKIRRTNSDESEEDEENIENVVDKEYEEDKEDEILVNNKVNDIKTESEIENFIKLCQKYYDKKQQTKEGKIKKDETLNEIILEKEKETSHIEKSSTLQVSDTENELCDNQKNSILKTNTYNTKSDEKSSTSLKNTNNIKDKIHKKENDKGNCKSNNKSKSQDKNKTIESKKLKEGHLKRKLNPKKDDVKKKLKTSDKTEKYEEKEEENEDYLPSLEFEDPKRKPILDSPLEETTSRENVHENSNLTKLKTIANTMQEPAGMSNEIEIDPKKYVNIKPKHLKTQLPDVATAGDEDSEQEEETHRIMSEAFADDDVIEEFRKEKEEEMKKLQPQSIDLSLPGWGSWGGPNIKKSKVARKKSRFILNVPKQMPRKPENQGDVIVFEHENEKLRKHLVKELPYPFTRVKDFEATIRAPISRTFVPMNAHLRLIQPSVKTKLGQVIEPMDENELVKEQPMVKKSLKHIKAKNYKKKNIIKNNGKKKHEQNV
ncbi:U3 small nucleolar RNA-associated protein 14 like protein B [Cyphomyrmex costatus]|uniref:U3 small nucleolar RNA-associated protein 14 like protein B n=1 Tax=Cyphomyrmex costatus TaxID=456900 RepID=A0A195CX90_9HYME|nr:U3 small nucleolar RNA-associated protein 14 like protein B [Cyphomyrmex costatus]